MLRKLPEDPRRKFIWAEISYFSMWWDELEEDDKEIVRRLLLNNQLEIVSGGWVMNDEANSHWISIMHQFTEGHQWLQENLNYTPVSHWSIDPFGMSSTQPTLLKEMGLQNMLIQRVHYSVKKHLASQQQLEFRWRQLWDGNGKTDMFTHMMPFYSYDIPHTCGPDPKICCQFDFKRLPNHGLHCPWKVSPQVITDKNVANRVQLLLDQYRKKSKLFKTSVILAPLGDDFRYDHPTEWDVQYNNYQKLFDYMNSNLHLNVKAQFGTLSDYFMELHKEKNIADFPVLSGDFFTYADRDDHYWSGYYTSRPFYKRMDRVLLSYIRAAETIHTLAHLSKKPGYSWIVEKNIGLQETISNARKALSLFQHHDGITGTAKDHVVVDYGNKILSAINGCQHVIQICAHILLKGIGAEIPNKDITIGVPEIRTKKIVIFNPLTFSRQEVVTFHVSTPYIEVIDSEGRRIHCQISPIFEYPSSMSQTKYHLSFIANIPPLGLVSYTMSALWENNASKETEFASVKIFNYYGEVQAPKGFKPEIYPSSSEFSLQNGRASFNKLGLLKSMNVGKHTLPVHLDFAKAKRAIQMHRDCRWEPGILGRQENLIVMRNTKNKNRDEVIDEKIDRLPDLTKETKEENNRLRLGKRKRPDGEKKLAAVTEDVFSTRKQDEDGNLTPDTFIDEKLGKSISFELLDREVMEKDSQGDPDIVWLDDSEENPEKRRRVVTPKHGNKLPRQEVDKRVEAKLGKEDHQALKSNEDKRQH
ncbi:hypothetical protein JTB14_033084 [Gonioctena quinquepunctata]|nr:hypothetical protein JTB14_033084 [Gonioctena quinquepunctata]